MKTTNKVVLVGAGAVGTTFLYSAMSQGIAEEYGVIDINKEAALGQKLDLEDAIPALPQISLVENCSYDYCSNADVIVITAGRPQKEGETRLEMIADNAKIMKSIAEQIKASGFSGITLIASNPVDVMTAVYQKVTGYHPKKVISSSCSLDTNRLKLELAKIYNVSPRAIGAFVIGEHGDSSVSTLDYGTIQGIPFHTICSTCALDDAAKAEIHERVYKKAYEIINRKRATFYGIGAALADVTKSILRNEKKVFSVGTLLNGEYGQIGVYAGIPCIVGNEGVISTLEFPLSDKELEQFENSIKTLKEATAKALKAIE